MLGEDWQACLFISSEAMASFYLTVFFCSVFLILPFNPSLAQAAGHAFIPQEGRLLIIGQDKNTIENYIRNIGIVPGGFMLYTSVQSMDGLMAPADHGGGLQDARYLMGKYPNALVQLGLYMKEGLDDVLEGRFDKNIAALAKWLKFLKRPVYLRIGYEFDLADNNYDPVKYQNAYRYIVDRLRAEGVKNVNYVWHSAVMVDNPGKYMDWYPGDDYVDWFGISLFSPQQIRTAEKFILLAKDHQKPVMIAESTPAGAYTVRGRLDWFKHYFDFIEQNDIRVVCYINSDWDKFPLFKSLKWGDSRIQKDQQIRELWLKEIRDNYLQASRLLFYKLSVSADDLTSP
ncbi:MAG: hypothetical protein HQL16_03645 [Candidatus Omnitrophica bacterium]|nr:hypothetical protein [Candidatus Omnitrophota bacterium]